MTNEQISIEAEVRERTGTRFTQRLRKSGRLPGVIYGQETTPTSISLDEKEMLVHLHSGARVMSLNVSGKTETCLVKDLQFGFLGDNVIHIDFARVNLDQIVTVNVPVITTGTPKLAGDAGAMLEVIRNEIEVECKVSDIPSEIRVDITEMGEALTVGDLEFPAGVKPTIEPEKHIVHITIVKDEEAEGEEAGVDAEGAEPEVISKDKGDDDATEESSNDGDEG
ncbi:MAG: 50S ribosomal protein L25 [Phycisphaerae bacterium]|nr:50S ribosomal protein L25 [Phycisphaerae bacterium]MDG1899207.1 50S ribosomal protein L25 [Phycisphaerales bacterium]|tara:strand:- start:152 stop:823 length:672 start_codon:yes stop_codon:yes gene_type:complete